MPTKYAKARDVAGQWRSEYKKVKRENKSLRRVYQEALSFVQFLGDKVEPQLCLPMPLAVQYDTAIKRLMDAQLDVVFAEGGE